MRNSTEEGCAKGKNNWEGNRRAVERKEKYRVGRVGPWEPRMRGTSGTSLERGKRPDHDSDGPAGRREGGNGGSGMRVPKGEDLGVGGGGCLWGTFLNGVRGESSPRGNVRGEQNPSGETKA